MDIKKELLIRVYILALVFVVVSGFLFWKAFKISVLEGEKWREIGSSLYLRYLPIEPDRGNILACDGSFLATSLPFFDIRMDLKADGMTEEVFNANVDSLSWYLSQHVNTTRSAREYKRLLIEQRLKGNRYLLIKKDASYAEMKQIRSFPLFRKGPNVGGFISERKSRRQLPFGHLAARTIGLDRENAQKVGLEATFGADLRGEEGRQLRKRVGRGVWIPVNDLSQIEPKKGSDVYTTLDVNIQDVAHNALEKGLYKHGADKGVAIVMEVETGAIRAMVNLQKKKGSNGYGEYYNHAIGTSTEPGSTMKTASLLALLEGGSCTPNTAVNLGGGKKRYYDRWMKDSRQHGVHASNLQYAFEHSSNVGISSLVDRHFGSNPSDFIKYLKRFGLQSPCYVEIEGEVQPFVKEAGDTKSGWSGISLPWMSIGYEVQLTPLQVLKFYNAVANDGRLMKPYLVEKVVNDGLLIKQYGPRVVQKQIASMQSIKTLQNLLEGVVVNGTGSNVATENFRIAGKTGTAQTNYGRGDEYIGYQASFAGYFPADNPKYSIIVVIYNPDVSTGYYGSAVAGPVFKEIAEKMYATKAINQKPINQHSPSWVKAKLPASASGFANDFEHVFRSIGIQYEGDLNADWARFEPEEDQVSLINEAYPAGVVPNVKGMGLRDATYLLENAGLKVKSKGMGKVVSQSLRPGLKIDGQTIELRLD
jgi:cell division protein FtsI (penicillin-binding protein 3)